MPSEETIKEVLEYLESKEIHFISKVEGESCFDLTKNQVLLFLKDRDAAYADFYGVPIKIYRAWKNFDGCEAMTKRKRKCRYPSIYRPDDPKEFKFGISDRCPIHRYR